MFGTFQQSTLRIEVPAAAATIENALTQPAQLQQWLFPVRFEPALGDRLTPNLTFTSWLGPIAIQHHVEYQSSTALRFLLSQSIDGFHEWMWGEGWVQSRLEGITLLPINALQTVNLLRFRQFVGVQSGRLT